MGRSHFRRTAICSLTSWRTRLRPMLPTHQRSPRVRDRSDSWWRRRNRLAPCQRRSSGGRIGRRDELRHDRRRTSKGGVVEHRQVLVDGAAGRLRRKPFGAWDAALTVGLGLDQARVGGEAFAPTRPSDMQRSTTVSNKWRSRSLSRKRPWRVLEKVEWSGTPPSRPSRQNQR